MIPICGRCGFQEDERGFRTKWRFPGFPWKLADGHGFKTKRRCAVCGETQYCYQETSQHALTQLALPLEGS